MVNNKFLWLILYHTSLMGFTKTYNFSNSDQDKMMSVPPSFFKQFSNFTIMYHYDFSTGYQIDHFIPSNDNIAYILNNYNCNITFIPPDGYDILHIVNLGDSYNFEDFARKDENLDYQDMILFIIEDNFEDLSGSFWFINGIERAISVFVYDVSSENLYHVCYFCNINSAILKRISAGNETVELRSYFNKFKDFKGHTFKVGGTTYRPYFDCQKTETVCDPQFEEGDLLKALASYLNFKYNLIEYTSENFSDGIWNGMIDTVNAKEIDWALSGISPTLDREELVDFTRQIRMEGYTVIYSVDNSLSAKNMRVLALNFLYVSLSPCICVIFIGFIALMSGKIHRKSHFGSAFLYMGMALKIMIEQPSLKFNKIPFSIFSLKNVLLFWTIMSVCLTVTFRSSLTSSLVSEKPYEPGTVSALVDLDYIFQVDPNDWTLLRENLEKSSDITYKSVIRKIHNDLEICESAAYIKNRRAAILEEESFAEYVIQKDCFNKKYITSDDILLMRKIENLFPSAHHAWAFQMGSPVARTFSRAISKLDDAGILLHWQKQAWATIPKSNQGMKDTRAKSIRIQKLLPAFYLLLIGLSVSLLILLFELIYSKMNKYFLT